MSDATHQHDLRPFAHSHHFGDEGALARTRALWWVTWITLATMALELAAGYWAGSLALVADGFGTHIPKGYLYFAMAFSVGVEMVNLRLRKLLDRRRRS